MIENITYKLTTQRDVKVGGVNWRIKGTHYLWKQELLGSDLNYMFIKCFLIIHIPFFRPYFFPTKESNLFFFFSLQKSSVFVSPHLNFKAPVAKVVYKSEKVKNYKGYFKIRMYYIFFLSPKYRVYFILVLQF